MAASTRRDQHPHKLAGKKRDPRWRAWRCRQLAGKCCAACGGKKKLELHHIIAFHDDPSRELDAGNVIPLCEAGRYGVNCHLTWGHDGNYRRNNPNVVADAAAWRAKVDKKFRSRLAALASAACALLLMLMLR